jgi:tRNA threonylcarbamoyladenosine biosynthesis protein TsaE
MPVSALAEHPFDLPDEAATQALAARFAHAFAMQQLSAARRQGLQVQLNGDLGAGKTAFVRAALRALGHAGRVRSPTYTLVELYQIPLVETSASSTSPADSTSTPPVLLVHHFDLYRFSDAAEWHEAGFDEYLASQAINLIEWPSRAGAALGLPDLQLDIDIVGDGRTLTARAFTPAGLLCLSEVSKQNLPSC